MLPWPLRNRRSHRSPQVGRSIPSNPGKRKGKSTRSSSRRIAEEKPSNVLFVDVRTPFEYAAGHFEGAKHIYINDLFKNGCESVDQPVPERQLRGLCMRNRRQGRGDVLRHPGSVQESEHGPDILPGCRGGLCRRQGRGQIENSQEHGLPVLDPVITLNRVSGPTSSKPRPLPCEHGAGSPASDDIIHSHEITMVLRIPVVCVTHCHGTLCTM